jgi:preprotein translocase subunit YajC
MTASMDGLTMLAAEVSAPAPPAGATTRSPGPGALFQFAPLILLMVAFFWFMSRSQKKRERQRQEMLDAIKPKDDVMTVGGIHGRVLQIREDEVVLRVDPDKDVRITIAKTGISRKLGDEEPK